MIIYLTVVVSLFLVLFSVLFGVGKIRFVLSKSSVVSCMEVYIVILYVIYLDTKIGKLGGVLSSDNLFFTLLLALRT